MFALYRGLSAYGSSYWRALVVLLAMLILASALFMWAGLRSVQNEPNERSRLIQCHIPPRAGENRPTLNELAMDYADAFTQTLSVMIFQRERAYRPANRCSRALESIVAVTLSGQVTLLLLALRRRFKR